MRLSSIYLYIAFAARVLGRPGVLPDSNDVAVNNNVPEARDVAQGFDDKALNVYTEEKTATTTLNDMEKRAGLLEVVGAFITASASAVFPVTIGAYTWVSAVWNTAARCYEGWYDCLFGVADAVFGVWRSAFTPTGGINKRGVGQAPVHAMTERDNTTGLHWEFHVPFAHHKRLIQVIRNEFNFTGNHTFRHVATVYRHDVETHQLFYRHAHPDDLGKANDGTYHHIRANYTGPAPPNNGTVSSRAESAIDHVVGDYLWRDGQSALFNDVHNEDNIANDIGSSLAWWMENNNSEATCASIRTYIPVGEGGPVPEYENQGVFAYGWNDAAFGFQGRAGSWVDQCN